MRRLVVLLSPLLLGPMTFAVAQEAPSAAPARATWTIDTRHSELNFRVRHLVSRVNGTFTDWSGTLQVNRGAWADGEVRVEVKTAEGPITLKTTEIAAISGDIMGQIYARDFKMIDQSDMIVSLVPELPSGKPGLSSGVERELHHAFEGGKEVYVIWACKAMPSPFITETATRVFRGVDEAIEYFSKKGYFERRG